MNKEELLELLKDKDIKREVIKIITNAVRQSSIVTHNNPEKNRKIIQDKEYEDQVSELRGKNMPVNGFTIN